MLKEQIAAYRKQKGMSQEELAEKLQVSRQAVSKWEAGQSVPDLERLVEMADLFQITLDQLVRGESEEEPAQQPPNSKNRPYVISRGYEYRSETTLWGLPLLHVNWGTGKVSKGIIALGDQAVGILSFGGAATGVIAAGGMSVGVISLGGISVGGLALGGIALGGLAFGGLAVGVYALGGVAIALQIAAGGTAVGDTAIGNRALGQYVLNLQKVEDPARAIQEFLHQYHPGLWQGLVKVFSLLLP